MYVRIVVLRTACICPISEWQEDQAREPPLIEYINERINRLAAELRLEMATEIDEAKTELRATIHDATEDIRDEMRLLESSVTQLRDGHNSDMQDLIG